MSEAVTAGFTNFDQVDSFLSKRQNTYPFITPSGNELAGKSILITGASKGIGRALAVRCVKAGCTKIAIGARSSLDGVAAEIHAEAKQENRSVDVIKLELDVASAASVQAAAAAIEEAFGGSLDILINNAGMIPFFVPIVESDPMEWWQGWQTNINGTYLCCRYFLPLLLKGQGKTIINTSSIGGHALVMGASSYQGAKMAVCRFTEFVQREYGSEGIVCIVVHPGSVHTELGDRMPKEMHRVFVDDPLMSADALIWLSKERRTWLGGRFVSCAWDMEELEKNKEDIERRDILKFRLTL